MRLKCCVPFSDKLKIRHKDHVHSYSHNCLKSSQDYNHMGGELEWWNGTRPHQCDLGLLPGPAVI